MICIQQYIQPASQPAMDTGPYLVPSFEHPLPHQPVAATWQESQDCGCVRPVISSNATALHCIAPSLLAPLYVMHPLSRFTILRDSQPGQPTFQSSPGSSSPDAQECHQGPLTHPCHAPILCIWRSYYILHVLFLLLHHQPYLTYPCAMFPLQPSRPHRPCRHRLDRSHRSHRAHGSCR